MNFKAPQKRTRIHSHVMQLFHRRGKQENKEEDKTELGALPLHTVFETRRSIAYEYIFLLPTQIHTFNKYSLFVYNYDLILQVFASSK